MCIEASTSEVYHARSGQMNSASLMRSLRPQVFQLDPIPLGSVPYHSNLGLNEHCIGFLSGLCMVGTQANVFKVHDTE